MDDFFLLEDTKDVILRPTSNQDRPPWCKNYVYDHFNQRKILSKEILDFSNWIKPTNIEIQIRTLITNKLKNLIHLNFPKFELILHGSTSQGIVLPNGDLDYIIIPDINNSLNLYEIFEILNNNLLYENHFFSESIIISSAKVPIIKGVESLFGIKIDIAIYTSIESFNGLFNIERTSNLFLKYPTLFPLTILLKIFLIENDLNENFKGGISSTILIQLVLFIIQSSPISLKNSLGDLLIGFFNIYGNIFNFKKCGLSTRNGGYVFLKHTNLILEIEDPQNPNEYFMSSFSNFHKFIDLSTKSWYKLRKPYKKYESMILKIINLPLNIINSRIQLETIYLNLFNLNNKLILKINNLSSNRYEAISQYITTSRDIIRKKRQINDENFNLDLIRQQVFLEIPKKEIDLNINRNTIKKIQIEKNFKNEIIEKNINNNNLILPISKLDEDLIEKNEILLEKKFIHLLINEKN